MNLTKIVSVAGIATALGLGLGACGTTTHTVIIREAPKPAVVVTHTATPAPKIVIKTVAPVAPAVVVVPEPAGFTPGLTACGLGSLNEEVYAETSTTSCPFALNVESAYATSGATNQFYAYSPVTGQGYLMTANTGAGNTASGNVVVTGGTGALVEFNF